MPAPEARKAEDASNDTSYTKATNSHYAPGDWLAIIKIIIIIIIIRVGNMEYYYYYYYFRPQVVKSANVIAD